MSEEKLGVYFLITLLPVGLLKIQNFQNSHVTVTWPISNSPLLPQRFCKEQTMKIWLLSKFIVIPAFITKCNKKTPHTLSEPFWKNSLESMTNRENFKNFQIIITKCDINYNVKKNVHKIYRKHLKPPALLKKDSGSGAFLWLCESFQSSFFAKHV